MAYNPINLGPQLTNASQAVVLPSDQTPIPVTGTFFQATQPVSLVTLPPLATGSNVIGSISNTTFASTQSGTWNINNISGTISLPTGASTEATLSALNTKIPANLTVTATRLLVDGSGVTQPVSGSVSVSNFPATQPVSGSVSVSNFPATQPVSGTVTANISGSISNTSFEATQATAANLNATVVGTVTANIGTTGGLALDATLTGGTQKTRITDGSNDAEVVPLTNYNGVAVAVVDGSGNQITSFGGGTQYADGAARGSATGTLMMVDDGTSVQSAAGTATGELKTVNVPNTSGGLSANRLTVTNAAQNVNTAAAPGQVYGWYVYNPNTTIAYVQFYNSAAAGVTVGTTPPSYSIGIPGLSAANVFNSIGIAHGSGISIAATTLSTGSVAPGSALEVNIFYK